MIRTRGLAYRYGAGRPLQFADVDLPQGGTLLLQGRSGAGKSTWLALVAGLVVALKAYWLELLMRSRRASRTSKIL